MSAKTSIEWTGRTWNPLVAYLTREVEVTRKNGEKVKIPAGTRGWFCTKCSPGCLHCYAEKINLRLGNGLTYQLKNLADIEFRLVNLDAPLRWKKPGFVFVNSMTDLFHEAVPDELIDQVFVAMALAPNQTFQILTKRAKRMREYLSDPDRLEKIYNIWPAVTGGPREVQAWPLPNVWLGVSAENQKYWNERVAELIQIPAAVRFVSAEPLLSPIDINPETHDAACGIRNGLICDCTQGRECRDAPSQQAYWSQNLDWVICGGESGSKARPMHPDWARGLRDQCSAEMIPFFFKQWGEWFPQGNASQREQEFPKGTCLAEGKQFTNFPDGLKVYRIGKKEITRNPLLGRLLAGREWNEMPEVKNGKA